MDWSGVHEVKRGFRDVEEERRRRSRRGERIKWKARNECMRWRSLWGEIFPLRGAVLRSLIFEKCCDARQEYSRATTAATGGKKKERKKNPND